MSTTPRNSDADKLATSTGLITIGEVAAMLNISISTAWRCVSAGELPPPAMRIHKRLCRFNRRDVERFIAKGGAPGPSPARKPKAASPA
jgi:excisionase family DNA binding protein